MFTIVLQNSKRTVCSTMGNFKINLLNVEEHVPCSEFLECMHSMSYLPLISKPTRVSTTSAILIDNIVTNNLTTDSVESCPGILHSNISDRLPIFYIDKIRFTTNVIIKYITETPYTEQNITTVTQ